MTTQYLVDEKGKQMAVVLPIEAYDEYISDLVAVAERRGEERVSLEKVKQRLIADGILQN